MRSLIRYAVVAGLGAGLVAPGLGRAAEPAGAAPVLVTIVVDQLAAWMADERWPALPADGGFARLRREGLYVRELRFGHAATDTAPGHSALFTGAVPHTSGIVANEVILSDGAPPVSVLADPASRVLVPAPAAGDKSSSSLARLRVPTLADRLREAHPGAVVVSLSLKDRGALFGAGRRPTAAIWFDPELASFVTSTAIASEFPAWAARAGDGAAVRAAMARPWDVADRAWVAAHAETADDAPGEGDYLGLGKTFPHAAASAKALRATPMGDELLFALADAAATEMAPRVHAAGAAQPFLLAVSLSSHDYVAHVFGPHSWEAWDELARLDRGLARFLARLDELFGADGYAVMLTADHGSNALPELATTAPSPWCRAEPASTRGEATGPSRPDHWERTCGPRHRLVAAELVPALEAQLDAVMKSPERGGGASGPWVSGMSDPLLYLSARAHALPPDGRRKVLRATADFLQARFGIARVLDLRATPARCPPLADESWRALVCRSSQADGPGDFYFLVRPGTFADPRLAVGAGSSHGSPYLYDRAVPLLVRAPGRVSPGQVRARPVAYTTFARTAASLLGIAPPAAAAAGEDLTKSK